MSDPQKIDQHTLFKLTNTIEKAATLSMASNKSPSLVLALQLKKADIPKLLAKVATHAFNRRLSITKLASGNDDTKALSFDLADVSLVLQLLGFTKIKKQASLNLLPFVFSVNKGLTIKKSASEEKLVNLPLLTVLQGLRKILKAIDEGTIYINDLRYAIQALLSSLDRLKKRASALLLKDLKLSRQLVTHYGDTFTKLFSLLPESHLNKYAAYTVIKKNAAVLLVDNAIKLQDSIQVKKLMLKQASLQLNNLCNLAMRCDSLIKLGMINGMVKLADGWSFGKEIIAHSLINPTIAPINATKEGFKGASLIGDRLSLLASLRVVIAPDSVLTAKLLADDKFYDAGVVTAAVMAHPSTKLYPTREILRAVNDTLVAHPLYRSPRYFQHMLVLVKLRLTGGGLLNMAGLSAGLLLAKRTALADKILKLHTPLSLVKALPDLVADREFTLFRNLAKELSKVKSLSYVDDGNLITHTKDHIKLFIEPILKLILLRKKVDALLMARRLSTIDQLEIKLNKAKKILLELMANKVSIGRKTKQPFSKVRSFDERQKILQKAQDNLNNLLGGGSYQDLVLRVGADYKISLPSAKKPKKNKDKDKDKDKDKNRGSK